MKKPNAKKKSQISVKSTLLPYGRQTIHTSDIDAVISVLKGDWLTTGPTTETFEDSLRTITLSRYCIACSSGTAALHLAMLAAGIGPGDTVIVPANTFLATANMVRLVGAEVLFADVDPHSGLMLTQHAEEALARTEVQGLKAIIPVYFAGQCSHPGELQKLAYKHNLLVIADACHALGTRYHTSEGCYNIGSNTHSDMTAFSFHPVKTITTGEGGAVTTDDPDLDKQLRLFRNHGMTRDPDKFENSSLSRDSDGSPNSWYYELRQLGFNYRISDLHCALGTSQLLRLTTIVQHRRALLDHYYSRSAHLMPFIRPLKIIEQCDAAWHLAVFCIDFKALGTTRNHVISLLQEKGIGSQVHYIPVPWQPYYRNRYGPEDFPGVRAYYNSCLSLPLFESMTTEDVDRVIETLEDCFKQINH